MPLLNCIVRTNDKSVERPYLKKTVVNILKRHTSLQNAIWVRKPQIILFYFVQTINKEFDLGKSQIISRTILNVVIDINWKSYDLSLAI